MGYVISGDLYNTADYGLPQQRGRAWLLCVQGARLPTSEAKLGLDMQLFSRTNVPLSACVDLVKDPCPSESQKAGKGGARGGKWKQGFDEQCKIYEKAGNVGDGCHVAVV